MTNIRKKVRFSYKKEPMSRGFFNFKKAHPDSHFSSCPGCFKAGYLQSYCFLSICRICHQKKSPDGVGYVGCCMSCRRKQKRLIIAGTGLLDVLSNIVSEFTGISSPFSVQEVTFFRKEDCNKVLQHKFPHPYIYKTPLKRMRSQRKLSPYLWIFCELWRVAPGINFKKRLVEFKKVLIRNYSAPMEELVKITETQCRIARSRLD